MIRHMVMWRLAESAQGRTRSQNAEIFRDRLLELPAKIPEIRRFEVGINEVKDSCASHVVLESDFDSWEALRQYQRHPDHQALIRFLDQIRTEKRFVDYEV